MGDTALTEVQLQLKMATRHDTHVFMSAIMIIKLVLQSIHTGCESFVVLTPTHELVGEKLSGADVMTIVE